MRHRMLRSIVLSSAFLLESVGCSVSHPTDPEDPPPPPDPDAGRRGDGGWFDDAGELRDAEARWDAWRATDAGPSDAGPSDAGSHADAGDRDAGALPFCDEIGWPTTKGFWCVIENDRELCGGAGSGDEPVCERRAS